MPALPFKAVADLGFREMVRNARALRVVVGR
jgi:hypothetical protein